MRLRMPTTGCKPNPECTAQERCATSAAQAIYYTSRLLALIGVRGWDVAVLNSRHGALSCVLPASTSYGLASMMPEATTLSQLLVVGCVPSPRAARYQRLSWWCKCAVHRSRCWCVRVRRILVHRMCVQAWLHCCAVARQHAWASACGVRCSSLSLPAYAGTCNCVCLCACARRCARVPCASVCVCSSCSVWCQR